MTLQAAERRVALKTRVTLISSIFDVFGVWRQRRHLAGLDAHLRKDLGLGAADIIEETRRPVWDVPQRWRL